MAWFGIFSGVSALAYQATRGAVSETEAAAIGAHFEYLQAAHASGKAVFVGRTLTTDENTFGIAVYHAEDETDARAFMETMADKFLALQDAERPQPAKVNK